MIFGVLSGIRGDRKVWPTTAILVLALLVATLVEQTVSTKMNAAAVLSSDSLGMLFLVLVVILGFSNSGSIATVFVSVSTLVLLLGWVLQVTGRSQVQISRNFSWNPSLERHVGLFTTPNGVGLLAGATLACAVGLGLSNRWLVVPALTVVAAEFRMGLLAILVLLALRLFARLGHTIRWIAAATILGLGQFGIANSSAILGVRPGASDSSTGRATIWSVCRRLSDSGTWFGLGPNAAARRLGMDSTSSLRVGHCHNQLIDDWVNFGVIGVLMLALLVICTLVVAVITRSRLLGAVALFTALASVTETPLRFWGGPEGLWMVTLVWTLLLSEARKATVSKGLGSRAPDMAQFTQHAFRGK